MSKLKWAKGICGVFLLCAATAIALPAQTLTTLHSFTYTDGSQPLAALIQATDGNFYGTTYSGGLGFTCIGAVAAPDPRAEVPCGTVFRITPSGALTMLQGFDTRVGANPHASLVQATDGSFYGTALFGGPSLCQNWNFCGSVVKFAPLSSTLTLLHGFDGTDGYYPSSGLVQGIDGNLYGTTSRGGFGKTDKVQSFDGTVFKITPSGTLTTLHSFCVSGCTAGDSPTTGLVQSTDGNFYGTTAVGGANCCGTVFKITPSGILTTLHSFDLTDGSNPAAGVIQATDGNFYGTTVSGGASNVCSGGCGTIFEITPGGTLTTLHSFDSTDGAGPVGGLVQATDGNFYGTAEIGGPNNFGTIFEITAGGTLTILYSFCSQTNCTDGDFPGAGLVQGTDGNLYGTTIDGGTTGSGTVFRLSVGLGPFVETQTSSGEVGTHVNILGTDLIGATSVTFNGTPAIFTVHSHSLITARIPSGATTGTVQVVTPGGTLSSNVPFTVRP